MKLGKIVHMHLLLLLIMTNDQIQYYQQFTIIIIVIRSLHKGDTKLSDFRSIKYTGWGEICTWSTTVKILRGKIWQILVDFCTLHPISIISEEIAKLG